MLIRRPPERAVSFFQGLAGYATPRALTLNTKSFRGARPELRTPGLSGRRGVHGRGLREL